jgi:hypothetical protein
VGARDGQRVFLIHGLGFQTPVRGTYFYLFCRPSAALHLVWVRLIYLPLAYGVGAINFYYYCKLLAIIYPFAVLQLIAVPKARMKIFLFGMFFKEFPRSRSVLDGFG